MRIFQKTVRTLMILCSIATAHAAKPPAVVVAPVQEDFLPRYFEISGAGGVSGLHTYDTHLVISSSETDSNLVTKVTKNAAWKFGLGFYLWRQSFFKNHFLPRLLLEMNIYHNANRIKGDVLQYQFEEFNNYFFTAPQYSTRFMLDLKPILATFHGLSPYLILGVGGAWNTLGYYEQAKEGIDPTSVLILPNRTQRSFAGDLGVGARYALSPRISATFDYVFSSLKNTSPSATPVTDVNLLAPPIFSNHIYSLLFGLNFGF